MGGVCAVFCGSELGGAVADAHGPMPAAIPVTLWTEVVKRYGTL